jgi:hypothetical protein
LRRLTFALAAILVAACGSAPVNPPGASLVPNFGQTLVVPTPAPTPDTSVAPADISTWLELAPVGLGFGIAFPGQPTVKTGKVGDPAAPTTFWSYTDPGGRKYLLARSKLPTGMLSDNTDALPDRFDETLFEDMTGGAFVSRDQVTVDGRPGISYTIRSGNTRSQGLLVLDKALLYRVSMTYNPDSPDDASLQAFLNSFTLLG